MPSGPLDPSNGWEALAADFIPQAAQSTIGATTILRWALTLPSPAALLDLGCGPGGPRAAVLHGPGRSIYAIDAAPSLVAAYRLRYPAATVACEAVESSTLFDRQFDGILAWGLLFLLEPAQQASVIRRVAAALVPGGRFLFTAPAQAAEWSDISTGRRSRSLGRAAYEGLLADCGLALTATAIDEGANHYYYVTTGAPPPRSDPSPTAAE